MVKVYQNYIKYKIFDYINKDYRILKNVLNLILTMIVNKDLGNHASKT